MSLYYSPALRCVCPEWVNEGDYDGPEDYGRAVENARCPLHT